MFDFPYTLNEQIMNLKCLNFWYVVGRFCFVFSTGFWQVWKFFWRIENCTLLGRWIDISVILFRLFRRLFQRMKYWTTNAKHDWSVRLRNEEISGSLYLVLKPSNQERRTEDEHESEEKTVIVYDFLIGLRKMKTQVIFSTEVILT